MALLRWRADVQCLTGTIALLLLTYVCFRLRLDLATAVGPSLMVVVLLSLRSLVASAVVRLSQASRVTGMRELSACVASEVKSIDSRRCRPFV